MRVKVGFMAESIVYAVVPEALTLKVWATWMVVVVVVLVVVVVGQRGEQRTHLLPLPAGE